MHSSMMRTARLLTVCRGVYLPWGVPVRGVYLPMGVYLPKVGCTCPGGCACPEGVSATPLWTDRHL